MAENHGELSPFNIQDKPLFFERATGIGERMDEQWGRFRGIVEGLDTGRLDLQKLPLGTESKSGLVPVSRIIPRSTFVKQEEAVRAFLCQNRFNTGQALDTSSSRSWDDAHKIFWWAKIPYDPKYGVSPDGFASIFYSRVELDADNVVGPPPRYNKDILSTMSRLLSVVRLSGIPVNIKHNSGFETIYGRDLRDAVWTSLAVFNEFSPQELLTQITGLHWQHKDEVLNRHLLEKYFMIAPFPARPIYESEGGTPVDPTFCIKDRLSHQIGLAPLESYKRVRSAASALRLGRMAAAARKVYDFSTNSPKDFRTGEEDSHRFVEAYYQRGIEGVRTLARGKVFTIETPRETQVLPVGDADSAAHIGRELDTYTLILYDPSELFGRKPENLYALVDWKQADSIHPLRLLFVFKVKPDDTVYHACSTLLATTPK